MRELRRSRRPAPASKPGALNLLSPDLEAAVVFELQMTGYIQTWPVGQPGILQRADSVYRCGIAVDSPSPNYVLVESCVVYAMLRALSITLS